MFTSMQIAVPGNRYRITRIDGLTGYRYLLVEVWYPRDQVWLVCSHIPLPPEFSEQDIERAVNQAADEYTSEVVQALDLQKQEKSGNLPDGG